MLIKKKITLILNDKNENGLYPLYCACNKNNIEMVQLLISYANEKIFG